MNAGNRAPSGGQSKIVPEALEQGDQTLRFPARGLGLPLGLGEHGDLRPGQQGSPFDARVAGGPGFVDGGRQDLIGPLQVRQSQLPERDPKMEQHGDTIRIARPKETNSPLQKRARRSGVAPVEGAPAGGPEQLGRPSRQLEMAPVSDAQLLPVPMRLLQVVAHDLLVLGEPVSRNRLEPPGESLVQLCPGLLGQRVVRRVPDEEMAEPKGVLSCELRPIGPDEILPGERHEVPGDGRSKVLGTQLAHRAAVEHLSLHGPAFDDLPLSRH